MTAWLTEGQTMRTFPRLSPRRTFPLSCFALVLLWLSIHHAAGPRSKAESDATSAEKAVRKVLDDQVTVWNKGDLQGFMKGYWSSPNLTFFSGNTKTSGWQATLERYQKRYQAEGREMGQLTFRELEIEVLSPTSAFVRGRFQLVLSKEKPTGLFTLVFKRFPEGWRIIHDHTSS
jgi:beta-aspartyl-peptidase (threonine type)